jgi:hypothetical protein
MERYSQLIIVLLIFIAISCSSSEWQMGEQRTVEGQVYVTGNDPFTQLAIDLGNGKYYILLCSPDVEKTLRANQGHLARVRAKGEKILAEGFAVTVLEAVVLQP